MLLSEIDAGKSFADIAHDHSRTVGGIRARLLRMASVMVAADGLSIDHACARLRVSANDVQRRVGKHRQNDGSSAATAKTHVPVAAGHAQMLEVLHRIEAKIGALVDRALVDAQPKNPGQAGL